MKVKKYIMFNKKKKRGLDLQRKKLINFRFI